MKTLPGLIRPRCSSDFVRGTEWITLFSGETGRHCLLRKIHVQRIISPRFNFSVIEYLLIASMCSWSLNGDIKSETYVCGKASRVHVPLR